MDTSTNRRLSVIGRVGMMLALLTVLAAVPQAALAKPKPAVTCDLHPGESTVTWKRERQTTRLELRWVDAGGAVVDSVTIIPTKSMHFRYSQQTPEGAAEFGVEFWDATGQFAVGGLTCT